MLIITYATTQERRLKFLPLWRCHSVWSEVATRDSMLGHSTGEHTLYIHTIRDSVAHWSEIVQSVALELVLQSFRYHVNN